MHWSLGALFSDVILVFPGTFPVHSWAAVHSALLRGDVNCFVQFILFASRGYNLYFLRRSSANKMVYGARVSGLGIDGRI
jgi:hypothetical protein